MNTQIKQQQTSRFATEEDVFSADFQALNKQFFQLQAKHQLLDQSDLNLERFEWADRIICKPAYYASRMWEYPFAILSGELKEGMRVADVGCGNAPFTAYLASVLGASSVTGYDPDVVNDDEIGISHFGARQRYLDQLGVRFYRDSMNCLSGKDGEFDVVYCLSVLEHVIDPKSKAEGLKEMARLVKPGGKLILAFDLGINLLLNNIWNVISCTGLAPVNLDTRWPQKRFVDYGGSSSVDVFGLILEKTANHIFVDCKEMNTMPMYRANKKMQEESIFYTLPYRQLLAAHDFGPPLGGIKIMIKHLFGRY